MIAKIADNKLAVAILVPLILAVAAWVSGVTQLPDAVAQHERRITNVEGDTKALRDSAIRAESSFKYIEESLKRIEAKADRRERGR